MNKTNAVVVTLVLLSYLLIACVKHDQHSSNQQIKNRGEGKDNWWQKLPRSVWGQFERIPQSQDWFEVYRVLPGVFAIYEPGQFDEVISYLIVGTDKALLFDTGLGIGDMKRVVTESPSLSPSSSIPIRTTTTSVAIINLIRFTGLTLNIPGRTLMASHTKRFKNL